MLTCYIYSVDKVFFKRTSENDIEVNIEKERFSVACSVACCRRNFDGEILALSLPLRHR